MPGVGLRYPARYPVGESSTDAALEFTGTSEKGLPWEMRGRQYWENYMGSAGGEKGKDRKCGLKKIFFWIKKKSFLKFNVNHNVWAEEERGDVNPSPGARGRRASSKRPQISAILLRPPEAPTYSPGKVRPL